MAFAWSLPASLSVASPAAAKGEHHVIIDVPAGPLSQSIASLARQAGISIGGAEPLANERAEAIHGTMTGSEALRRLLSHTSLRAVQVSDTAFRLERRPRPPRLRPAPEKPVPGDEIVVTATKQATALRDVTQPVSLLDSAGIDALGDAVDTGSLASSITGFSVTNLGPGRNRLFVRGVADSPFDGFGQSSVSVQVDDARATYDAPDPDLRLIDMAQVELLKGPQGPLYGSGALGGVFRLVPAKPVLDRIEGWAQLGAESVDHGGLAASAELVANVPLVTDRVAVRAVAYRVSQSGWIDDIGGASDVNHGHTTGGRIAVRARVGADWTVDLSGLSQLSSIADSQYVTGATRTLQRAAAAPEPQDTDFSLFDVAATGRIGSLRVTASTSLAKQELQATYDASQAASLLGAVAPARYFDDRHYQVLNSEARIGSAPGRFSWLAGISLLEAKTDAAGTITDSSGSRTILEFQRRITEVAAYGEASLRLNDSFRATVGGRLYRSAIDDERREQGVAAVVSRATLRASPSATLSWQRGDRLILFARYASASRPGGVDSSGQSSTEVTAYEADELQSYDLGLRWSAPKDGLALEANIFHSSWQHVQADYLDTNGLITTRNAGDATNNGVDISISWSSPQWTIGFGGLLQHARLDVATATGPLEDTRLPVVPDLAGHFDIARMFEAKGWNFRLGARATYTGDARLSFDPGLDRKTDEIMLLAASLAAARSGWRWRIGIDNLLDSHADTFAFGNPFSIRSADQRTPVKPRTLSLSLRRSW